MEVLVTKTHKEDYCTYNDLDNPDFWVDNYLDECTGIMYGHRVWDRDRVLLIQNKIVLRYMSIKDFNLIKDSLKKVEVKIR